MRGVLYLILNEWDMKASRDQRCDPCNVNADCPMNDVFLVNIVWLMDIASSLSWELFNQVLGLQ